MANRKKKPVEQICGNCRLFNPKNYQCGVAVLYAGEQFHLPVEPKDTCFFEGEFISKTPVYNEDGEIVSIESETFQPEVQQVRWYEEGNKVKIEYPKEFFGKEDGNT